MNRPGAARPAPARPDRIGVENLDALDVSVIICTRDRSSALVLTLADIGRLASSLTLNAEVIVIDNGSVDDTANVTQAAARRANSRLPIRYIHEPRGGQSQARNTGMAAAAGNVIVFTDDDIRVPENWIERLTAPIRQNQADAVAGGVKIAPHLHRAWMGGFFPDWFASTQSIDPKAPTRMVGANMAFSRAVLAKVPGFDIALGPGALGFGDETLFSWRLQRGGYRLVSAFDAAVEHHFDPSRLSRKSLLSASEKFGRSEGYLAHHWHHMQVDNLWRRQAHTRLRLAWRRLKYRQDCRQVEGMPDWEASMIRELHWYKQYIHERTLPPKY